MKRFLSFLFLPQGISTVTRKEVSRRISLRENSRAVPTPGQEQIAGQRIVFYFAPVNTAKWVYARQSKQPRVTILIQMNVCSSAYFSFFLSLRRAKDYILPVATNFHPFLLFFFFPLSFIHFRLKSISSINFSSTWDCVSRSILISSFNLSLLTNS